MRTEVVSRLRVTFGVDGPLSYVSVLDFGRLWERLLRRADVPIAYSQGFNPQARMQFAAALPVGYSSACELVDLYLSEDLAPEAFLAQARPQCPPGLTLLAAETVPVKGPTPQALMRSAEYDVAVWADAGPEAVHAAIADVLGRETILRLRRKKKGQMGEYDLRALIYAIQPVEGGSLASDDQHHGLTMHLRCGSHGAGRPEEILDEFARGPAALAITRRTIRRTRLIWDAADDGPSHDALGDAQGASSEDEEETGIE
jgi:radical SAM-linked protein